MPSNQIAASQFGTVRAGTVVNQTTGLIGETIWGPFRVLLAAPLAASLTYYANGSSANGSLATINKKPDFPRNVEISASGATTANVKITGLDTQGYQISETLALNGTSTVLGKKSYSEILTVLYPTVSATTINVGIGVKFGVYFQTIYATILFALLNGVPDTNLGTFVAGGTTAGTDYYGTWSPATAPNASNNYQLYYIPTNINSYGVNN
jgi:hypothetical protein